MVSDIPDEQSSSVSSETTFSTFNTEHQSLVASNLQDMEDSSGSISDKKFNISTKVSQSINDPIPILISKSSLSVGSTTPVLLQGTMPVPGTSPLSVPVSAQNFIPVKMQPSTIPTSTSGSAKPPDVQGLIIRTDSLTVRRKASKEDEKRESPKPDLSIIPILRNSSLENRPSPFGKTQKLTLLDEESYKDDFNKENSATGTPANVDKKEGLSDADSTPLSGHRRLSGGEEGAELDQSQDTEVKELLKWENGTGSLVGSDLKFTVNEFDAVELVEDKALDDLKSQITSLPATAAPASNQDNSSSAEMQNISRSQSLESTPPRTIKPHSSIIHVHHARKPNLNKKDDEAAESLMNAEVGCKTTKNLYDICCCKNCGCYGLSSEFFKSKENSFCTIACSEVSIFIEIK